MFFKFFDDNEVLSYAEICERLGEKKLTKRKKQQDRWDCFMNRESLGRKFKVTQYAEYIPPLDFKESKYSGMKKLIMSMYSIQCSRSAFYKKYLGIDLNSKYNTKETWEYTNHLSSKLGSIFNSSMTSLDNKGAIVFNPTIIMIKEDKGITAREAAKEEMAYYMSRIEYHKQLGKPPQAYYDLARRDMMARYNYVNVWREFSTVKKNPNDSSTITQEELSTFKNELMNYMSDWMKDNKANSKIIEYHNFVFLKDIA